MQKIMIVEDDPVIRDELALLLTNESYLTVTVTDFKSVAMQISKYNPDLILLDLNLPERDGLSVCVDIRKASLTPIIFVTSRDTAADELRALSLGGDDYITKPYNIPVLLARIKAVLRRSSGAAEPDILVADSLTLHLTQGTVSAGGKSVELTRNELKILSHLMTHEGKIVPRTDLIEVLWESQIYIDDNTLSVNVTRLRGKLEKLGLPDLIKTRRGLGYQL